MNHKIAIIANLVSEADAPEAWRHRRPCDDCGRECCHSEAMVEHLDRGADLVCSDCHKKRVQEIEGVHLELVNVEHLKEMHRRTKKALDERN